MTHRNGAFATANLCAATLLVASSFGCATATESDPDGGKPVFSGDAAVAGRVDAAVQGIRPDAGVPADAAPPPADASPDCVTGPVNLLSNAGFDIGLTPWVESSGGGFGLVVNQTELTGVDADSGEFLAWLGGYSGDTDLFHQDFFLPADATPVTMNGVIWIASEETLGIAFDTLELELVNVASGAALETLQSWSNLDQSTDWVAFNATVNGNYAGQTLRLRLTANLDVSNNTNFLLDTLSLNTTTCQ